MYGMTVAVTLEVTSDTGDGYVKVSRPAPIVHPPQDEEFATYDQIQGCLQGNSETHK
jgi:hypothetical protein